MQRLKLFDMPFGEYNKFAEIHLAVINKEHKKLEKLLQLGANPNQVDQDDGWTPLMWAVAKRDIESMKLLLAYNADPNKASDYGTTPISKTIQVAPNRDSNYYPSVTPEKAQDLMLKQDELTSEIVTLLLQHGADPRIKNHFGRDAYDNCNYDEKNKQILIEAYSKRADNDGVNVSEKKSVKKVLL